MFSRKSYFSTFILIFAMIVGVIVGLILGEKASVLNPLGDLFLNLLLVIIPPLIFLTISTSIAKITTPKRLRENTICYFYCASCNICGCSSLWHISYISYSTCFSE